jgi:putrescine aminotransferase
MKDNWISVQDVINIPYEECVAHFKKHINPGLVALLEMGEYTSIKPQSAKGATVVDGKGRRILDFVSSYGALNLGHNHPEVKAAICEVIDNERVDLSKELLSPYAACLAHNLSLLTPGTLDRFWQPAISRENGHGLFMRKIHFMEKLLEPSLSPEGKNCGNISRCSRKNVSPTGMRMPSKKSCKTIRAKESILLLPSFSSLSRERPG